MASSAERTPSPQCLKGNYEQTERLCGGGGGESSIHKKAR
jgi:hypothetical protein